MKNPENSSEKREKDKNAEIIEKATKILEENQKDGVDLSEIVKLPPNFYDKRKTKIAAGEKVRSSETEVSAYLLISECETFCRFAFSFNADNIILLDKSARHYAAIFQKILPIMALEYAKHRKIDPDEIKIPNIKFINPPNRLENEHEHVESPRVGNLSQNDMGTIRKMLPKGSHNVIFNEGSTTSSFHAFYGLATMDYQKQYNDLSQQNAFEPRKGGGYGEYQTTEEAAEKYKKEHKFDFPPSKELHKKYPEFFPEREEFPFRVANGTADRAPFFLSLITESTNITFNGLSGRGGGNLSSLCEKIGVTVPPFVKDAPGDGRMISARKRKSRKDIEAEMKVRDIASAAARTIIKDVYSHIINE